MSNGIIGLIRDATGVLYLLFVVAFALAVLFFFWGTARFIFRAGDEKAVEEGKRFLLWGMIAFFVIASIAGIIALIRSEIFGTVNFDSPEDTSSLPVIF